MCIRDRSVVISAPSHGSLLFMDSKWCEEFLKDHTSS
jgi:hypothetical protein